MNIKKLLAIFTLLFLMSLTLTGCESSFSFTYDLSTGEQVKVTLNTTKGHSLVNLGSSFKVVDPNDNDVTGGLFYLPDYFNELYNNISILENVELIEENFSVEPNYIFYKYSDEETTEWNYIIDLNDLESGIILSNLTSEASARETFELFTFLANPN